MSDGVKFIFKTLFKVPLFILISYGIFNAFAFCFIYFKMLGVSYVVMQTAVENNYLPQTELLTLYNYVNEFNNIEMVENATLIVGAENMDTANPDYVPMANATDTSATVAIAANSSDARRKVQYGHTVTVGVTCDYMFVWPLDYRTANRASDGTLVDAGSGAMNITSSDVTRNAITIVYTVPGLKYYPDLLTI